MTSFFKAGGSGLWLFGFQGDELLLLQSTGCSGVGWVGWVGGGVGVCVHERHVGLQLKPLLRKQAADIV